MQYGPPRDIFPYVKELCASISTSEPFFIEVHPGSQDVVLDCTGNVERRIQQEGGEAVLGWKIWEWHGIMIEAEFHTLWRDSQGQLHDITPNAHPFEKVLFLPDQTLVYEGKQINNIRKPLNKDTNVTAFIEVNDDIFAMMNKGERASQHGAIVLTPEEAAEMEKLEYRKAVLGMQIESRPPERNELCRCGSGLKSKKCCNK